MSNKNIKPFTLWFTGLSGSGKTTLAKIVKQKLVKLSLKSEIIDGDEIRKTISKDLGFSKKDIAENHRRILSVCGEHLAAGKNILVATISPHQTVREKARKKLNNFIEIYCACPFELCAKRDPKGLYKKVAKGEIKNFIGKKIEYEEPNSPEIIVYTHKESKKDSTKKILGFLAKNKFLNNV
jgi:adenylyl-sulfate kinase